MNRSIALIAALMLLLATVAPATGACCAGMQHGASMRAAMSCCTESCAMKRAAPQQNRETAVLTTAVPLPVLPAATVVAASLQPSTAAFAVSSHRLEAPPPFLLNEQFRI